MIKLSDYVMQFIESKMVKHVFVLSGGGCMHLVDSLGKNKNIEYICCLHEQAISIAVEAYGQHTNDIGVGLVTTGPGGTNALTGVTAAWIDSTPCMILSGQVKRPDMIGDSGVRQMGPQEVDIVSIVKPVTKYAVTIVEPNEIKYHLEKAYYLATSGRKGPVWIDIPLDVQGTMIDEKTLPGYFVEDECNSDVHSLAEGAERIAELLKLSRRPVVLAGNGIKLSGAGKLFLDIVSELNVPVLLTWKVIDLMEEGHQLYFGRPGTLGQRGANFILQNSDLLIVLGSRLDASITAFNHVNFAPHARKVLVDIDRAEIGKLRFPIDVPLVADIKTFLKAFAEKVPGIIKDRAAWIDYCKKMKDKYPVVLPEYHTDTDFVNTYVFIDRLSSMLTENDVVVPESSGGAGEVTYQAFKVKKGQKIKNAAGLGAMGFGLPYAIGACVANQKRRTILINGDGAFQLNIQELETLMRLQLPVKIFIWNNGGYASIMATQRNLFEEHYVASHKESGLTLPDVRKVAEAYGLKTFSMVRNSEIDDVIGTVLAEEGPVLCEINTSPFQTTAPKVQAMKTDDGSMISKPLEDMWPYLDEGELEENMICNRKDL